MLDGRSPSVKKFQADRRIILSQGQYVNTLTNIACLEELHFPLPNYDFGKQLYHHIYFKFKHFERISPRFWNLVSIPGSVWPTVWPWENLFLSFCICLVALMIFSTRAEQFNIRRCRAMCNISVLNNRGFNLGWVGFGYDEKEKMKTLVF